MLFAQYSEIKQFKSLRDPVFARLQGELELLSPVLAQWENRKGDSELAEILLSQLQFYSYTVKEGDSLFTIAADLMLNSDSISSLNGIEHPLFLEPGRSLLIPNIPGIYLRQENRNGLDRRLRESGRSNSGALVLKISESTGLMGYQLFPGERFTREERLYFISRPFKSPLIHFVMGSAFGFRIDPFSGETTLHSGIDLNVPKGTSLYPIKEGIIYKTGVLENYGLYIIINHEGGYSSLYGHLDQILVSENDEVKLDQIIAKTGNTGRSTGPHLHLELRYNNQPIDPVPLIRQ